MGRRKACIFSGRSAQVEAGGLFEFEAIAFQLGDGGLPLPGTGRGRQNSFGI